MDETVKKYLAELKQLGIEVEVLEHPQLVSVEAVQKYLGYTMADAGATLLMEADDKFVAIIRRGDTKLDNNKVKKFLGIKNLRMAYEEEFAKITGVPSGVASVYIKNIPTYIDHKVFEQEYINAGSGSLLVTLRYKTEDLRKIPGIEIVDFTASESFDSLEMKKSFKETSGLSKFEETKKALNDKKIVYEFITHPPIKTVEEGLAYLKINSDQGVSTLIFQTELGYLAVLRRDDHQIDLDKVEKLLKLTKIKFCSAAEVDFLTGCKVGYVSPYNPQIKTLMDETILDKEFVYLGTGSDETDLKIKPRELVKLTEAKIADIQKEGIKRIKSRILSGITPSGDGSLHIGNYLGAVKQFIDFAKSFDCYLMVADLHALPTIQNKEQLSKNTESLILNELALLGDLTNITFFRQSDVVMHAELTWILNNVAPLGLLKRAHAYKDKLQKDVTEEEINMGLFNYPILMAADILLYKPDFVPVGRDQKQHVEICRDIGERFNKTFPPSSRLQRAGKTKIFPLPEPHIPEDVAVIMGTDGKRKMSKSLGNIISIFDDEDMIKKQVMSTYTDPTRKHATDPGHIEGNMVFSYLDFFGNKQEVISYKEKYKTGKVGDVEVKNYLFKTLMEYFKPARERYQELKSNPHKVKKILTEGAEKARAVAGATMMEVRDSVGLTNKYSFFEY